jgi:hypothetical protein
VVAELAVYKIELRLTPWLHRVFLTATVTDGDGRVVVVTPTPPLTTDVRLTAVDVQHPIAIGVMDVTDMGNVGTFPQNAVGHGVV